MPDSISGSNSGNVQQLPPDDSTQPVQSSGGNQPPPTTSSTPPPTSTPTSSYGSASVPLLVAPATTMNPGDLTMLLGQLQLQNLNNSTVGSKDAIHHNEDDMLDAVKKKAEDLKKAKAKEKKAKKKGKLMKDLGWAGVALAAVVTVASLGTASGPMMALMVASLVLATTTQILETDPKTAAWLAKNPAAQWALVGVTAGVGLASAGVGIYTAITTVSTEAAETGIELADQGIEMSETTAKTAVQTGQNVAHTIENAEEISEEIEDIAEKAEEVSDNINKGRDIADQGDQVSQQSSDTPDPNSPSDPPPSESNSSALNTAKRAGVIMAQKMGQFGGSWAARVAQGLGAADTITTGGIGIMAGDEDDQAMQLAADATDEEKSVTTFQDLMQSEQTTLTKIVNDMEDIFSIDSDIEKAYGDSMIGVVSNITA